MALSASFLLGCLDSLHFCILCPQSSRYVSSLPKTASAALAHNSLASTQPASLQSLEIKLQQSWTSCFSSTALCVRTRRHNSKASIHVLVFLIWSSACFRALSRLNSNSFSDRVPLSSSFSFTDLASPQFFLPLSFRRGIDNYAFWAFVHSCNLLSMF